jgi:hypothetical protein
MNHRHYAFSHAGVTVLVLLVAGRIHAQAPADSALDSRPAQETFLSHANIVDAGTRPAGQSWRVTLVDGAGRTHAATVEAADGSDPTHRNYRFNVAAYELDKALALNLVVPTVEREIDGRRASVTWWVDDVAMNELDRRKKGIEPPDVERWTQQLQTVRVFDELISNTYRDASPALYLNTVWDNLLISKDWTIWLVDHTGAFRTRQRLEEPDSLTRCDRALLGKLRAVNRAQLQRVVGGYLSAAQLDALDVRAKLLVEHFDARIAKTSERAVLFDSPRRP